MNKFRAKRTKGISSDTMYDSMGERDRAEWLKQEEREGKITGLIEKPRVELMPGIHFKPDFSYIEDGRRVWEDYKGGKATMGGRFPIIQKIWRLMGPGPLRITTRGKGGFVVMKTILSLKEG